MNMTKLYGKWKEDLQQRRCRRNEKIYMEILAHLDNIHHMVKQCGEKINKLKQGSKSLKDHNNQSGLDRKINKWYNQLDRFLSHRIAFTVNTGPKDLAPSTLLHLTAVTVESGSNESSLNDQRSAEGKNIISLHLF